MIVILYQQPDHQWRWRIAGDNGEPMASGEAYADKRDAVHCLEVITQMQFDGEYLMPWSIEGTPAPVSTHPLVEPSPRARAERQAMKDLRKAGVVDPDQPVLDAVNDLAQDGYVDEQGMYRSRRHPGRAG